ncbi:alpha-amylase family protein [Shewanella sp.]|uniref:alpha-amylase family protein n=1 Tax=Shewanella sp. TaxID=50422 RepID=UPI004053ADDB
MIKTLSFPIKTLLLNAVFLSCITQVYANDQVSSASQRVTNIPHKAVVYQVFTRLYGNTNTNNKPWGTISDNGVGKFSDFTELALKDIKSLGVTHIWFTGVPHHALIQDYSQIGISHDDPDVVKGRAGSPYAIKDYYNVNPDLADNPAHRLAEFEALIERTHAQGMKVIIDIVPNHVARGYHSSYSAARHFGENDNTRLSYARHNNFYYVQDENFSVPDVTMFPLGGEAHPLSDGKFHESPAKWTGNGSRLAKPDKNDWYETVKINYGVRPDGSHDFPALPTHFKQKNTAEHLAFWQAQAVDTIPDSWKKFTHIAQYWQTKGVDGFRYDMAEMVPLEFWSYLNSHIKHTNPNAFLLAEVYNPSLYEDYIQLGKMDYLYDKVGLYDTLKAVIRGEKSTTQIATTQALVAPFADHMLHFLENHDEQRIPSADFAGSPEAALPAMVISATISRSPTLIYFAQDVGEAATQSPGFGAPTRTSIFDYVGVPAHQRWMNGGKFDGGQSSTQEKKLRTYYQKLLTLSRTAPAFTGDYMPLATGDDKLFAFSRFNKVQQLIIVSNFDRVHGKTLSLTVPKSLLTAWGTARLEGDNNAHLQLRDLLKPALEHDYSLIFNPEPDLGANIQLKLAPLQSVILALVN